MRDPSKPHAVSRSRACDIHKQQSMACVHTHCLYRRPESSAHYPVLFSAHGLQARTGVCLDDIFFDGRLFFGFALSVTSQYSTPEGDPRPTISTNNRDWCEACTYTLQATQEQGVLGLDGRTQNKKHELKHSVTDKNLEWTSLFLWEGNNICPQSP